MAIKDCKLFSITLTVLLLSGGFALGEEPATRPSIRPADIDLVTNLSTISFRSKGQAPKDAFMMLGQAAGVTICPIGHKTISPDGRSEPFDLWGSRLYPEIDFDLQSVSFWQAMDRLMASSGLEAAFGSDRWLVLAPDIAKQAPPDLVGPPTRQWNSDCLSARVRIEPDAGYHMELRSGDNPPDVTDVPAGLKMSFVSDPRLRICQFSQPVFESVRDTQGHELRARVLAPANYGAKSWLIETVVGIDGAASINRLAIFRGYLPVKVVTKWQSVEVPLRVGAKVRADSWEVEVVDENSGKNLVSGVGWFNVTRFFLGVERTSGSHASIPADLRSLVRVVDKTGAPLVAWMGGPSNPQTTVTGGVRQHFAFNGARWDEKSAEADKLIVEVPLEIKEVAIPFEFKDVNVIR